MFTLSLETLAVFAFACRAAGTRFEWFNVEVKKVRPDKTMWLSLIPTSHSKMLREQLLPRAGHRLHLSKQILRRGFFAELRPASFLCRTVFARERGINEISKRGVLRLDPL